MAVTVSLQKVVEEIECLTDEFTAYLNRQTGELYTLQDEEAALIEDDVDIEDLPDWQQKQVPLIRDILESEDWLPLPTKIDIHEWEIMDAFSRSRNNADLRDELMRTIRGAGAFRYFKDTIHRLGIQESWYRYRTAALEQIAIEWLDDNQISYTRDENAASAGES